MKAEKFRKVMALLRFNLDALFKFEILYKLFSVAFFIPAALLLFKLSLFLTGHSYLTADNIVSYAVNPITILILFLLILLLTFFSVIDISAVICVIDASYKKKKIGFLTAADFAWRNSMRIFQPRNFMFSLFVLSAALIADLGAVSSLFSSFSAPGFIAGYVKNSRMLSVLTIVLILVMAVFLFRRLYCFHYYTLEGCSFREAAKASHRLNKGKWIQDFFSLLLLQLLCMAVFYAAAGVIILMIGLLAKLFQAGSVLYSIVLGIIILMISILLAAYFCLSVPIVFTCISVLFYRHKERTGEKILPLQTKAKTSAVSVYKKPAAVLLLVCCVGLIGLFSYFSLNQKMIFNIENVTSPAISAHRGASREYPENTMIAFEKAADEKADWIELDIQLTKDGIPVVMHDSNLSRTAGVNRNIWDVTYAELKDVDVGSFFSPEFSDQRISTLNEVLDFAESRHINLNIELKPTGHETDFVPIVVSEILNHHFQNNCVITSQKYSILQEVKEYSSEVRTIYVMSVAAGNITLLQYADGFSIQSPFATKSLISRVHNEGKEIFVWTVNTQDAMKKMIRLNVDNIITDDIGLAKQTVYESETGSILLKYVSFISRIFGV